MKRLLLVFACAFGLLSFAPAKELKTDLNLITSEMTILVETMEVACDQYERYCYYQNGELIRCTEWTCVINMPEIIIIGT